jgi:hypothetical protein
MSSLDLRALAEIAARRRDEFARAAPFPHVVIDDFLRPEAAEGLLADFDASSSWTFLHHFNEKKSQCSDPAAMPAACRSVIADLQSPPFVAALETLTGVAPLLADPNLDGGGLHETRAGGFLNVHTDFLSHAKRRHWSRQINLLLFLNKDWPEAYRGWLELWDAQVSECVRRIAPTFNRCVIFRTSGTSFHGVPAGVACPPDRSRRSLALYYFRAEARACPVVSTRYVPLPNDPAPRRLMIHLDRWLIRAYTLLKRYTPITDALANRILRHF